MEVQYDWPTSLLRGMRRTSTSKLCQRETVSGSDLLRLQPEQQTNSNGCSWLAKPPDGCQNSASEGGGLN